MLFVQLLCHKVILAPKLTFFGFEFLVCSRSGLPVDLSFLRSVDLCKLDAFVKEEYFQVVEKKLVRVWIGNVEAVVVDKLHLLFLPFGPAIFADLGGNALAELIGDRSERELLVFLPATRAFKFFTK